MAINDQYELTSEEYEVLSNHTHNFDNNKAIAESLLKKGMLKYDNHYLFGSYMELTSKAYMAINLHKKRNLRHD